MTDPVPWLRQMEKRTKDAGLIVHEDYKATADRIETLTAENERLDKACCEWAEVSQANYQRANAAQSKLAKAVDFQHKWASGRSALGDITSYTTLGIGAGSTLPLVRFKLNYARGKIDVGEEDTVDQGSVG